MKLSVITDEISQDFEHALDVMCEYGVRGAELRALWNTNIADLDEEQTSRALRALHQRGMQVVALATPLFKCDLEPAGDTDSAAGPLHLARASTMQQQQQILERCAKLAECFETSNLRIFSFWRKSAPSPEIEKRIAQAFQQPLAYAEQNGLTFLLENEHACYVGSGAETARFMQHISSPALKVVWDPGNAFALGETAFPDGYEAAKPWMAHMHVKDAVRITTPELGTHAKWCVMGQGEVGYEAQFEALRRDGYTGWISLETHFKPEKGTGENGAGTAEDGSRACLDYLQRALAQ